MFFTLGYVVKSSSQLGSFVECLPSGAIFGGGRRRGMDCSSSAFSMSSSLSNFFACLAVKKQNLARVFSVIFISKIASSLGNEVWFILILSPAPYNFVES